MKTEIENDTQYQCTVCGRIGSVGRCCGLETRIQVNDLFGSWIAERYPTPESAKLQCAEATAAMVAEFPTLRRVRGYAMVGADFRPHWWCITPEGKIIDPTAHQWTATPVFYDVMTEDAEEPCGKCIYCGDLLYRSRGADSYLCENCKPNAQGGSQHPAPKP